MGISRPPKRSTLVAKKNHRRKSFRKDQFSLLKGAARWKIAALAPLLFACWWPQYRLEMMNSIANRLVRNSCYYEGKAYSVGIVIKTPDGIRCECSVTVFEGSPTWVSGNWS